MFDKGFDGESWWVSEFGIAVKIEATSSSAEIEGRSDGLIASRRGMPSATSRSAWIQSTNLNRDKEGRVMHLATFELLQFLDELLS
jgi:hypothetical protein